jgi:hypothetical protein
LQLAGVEEFLANCRREFSPQPMDVNNPMSHCELHDRCSPADHWV